jgi:hypothetical protein
MKYYLDIESGAVYQFTSRPTAETQYRFIEIDSSWFKSQILLDIFKEVRDTEYNEGIQNEQDDKMLLKDPVNASHNRRLHRSNERP